MKRNLLKILPFLLLGGVLGLAAAPAVFEAAGVNAETTFPINNYQDFGSSAVSGWDITPQSKYCGLYYSNGKNGSFTVTNKTISDFSVFASGTYSLKVYVSGICNSGTNSVSVGMVDSSGIAVGDSQNVTGKLGGGSDPKNAKETPAFTFTPSISVTGLKIEFENKCALTKVRWNITKVSDDDPEPEKPATYYTKVTDAASLQVGQTIVLGCEAEEAVAGPFSTNILSSKTAVFEDGKVYSNDAEEITLAGTSGAWKLLTPSGELGTIESGKFNLTTDTTWTISITDGAASITTENYGTIQYNAGAPRFVNYTSTQTPIEIYTKDGEIASYSVSYDANGGGTGSITDADSPYNKASTVTVLANTFTPITGKTFVEWNTKADGTGTSYNAGDTFLITADTTLYAIWEDEYIPIGDSYTKVTSTTDLASVSEFLFVFQSGDTVKVNGSFNSDHFLACNAKIIDNELTYNDESVTPLSLEKDGSNWLIKLNDEYLKLTSNSSNKLGWTDKTNANRWAISFSGDNVVVKSSISGVDHSIFYNGSGTGRFSNYSSSTMSPVQMWAKTGHAKEVHLSVDSLDLNVTQKGIITVSECIGFEPSSYLWEITSGDDVISIFSGQGTNEILVEALKEGEAEVYVTVDGVKATCAVTVHDYKYNILDKENYYITTGGAMLGGDTSYISEVDFSDATNMWHFEKAYEGDNSYYLSVNDKYLAFSEDVYEDGKNISQIQLSDTPINVWVVTYNETNGYKVATQTKKQGVRSLAIHEETWYAFTGNNYVDLLEGGTFDHYAVEALPTTKQYFVGDELKPLNSHVYAYYTNGFKAEITNKIAWEPLTAGTKAYGTCTILGAEVDIEMDGLKIYKGDASTFVIDGLHDTYSIGERINKDNLTVGITYKLSGLEDIVKDSLAKDDYTITPEKIVEGTEKIRIALAKDPTVYYEQDIEVKDSSYVAAAHIGAGDKIILGTLGYNPYEITGGKEVSYDGTKFGYETFDYMPRGEMPFEVGKEGSYYTLKDPTTGYYLKGDNSSLVFNQPDYKSVYAEGDGHYEFNLSVTIGGSSIIATMKTGLSPDFSVSSVFSSMDYVGGGYTDYVVGTSDLENNKFTFEMWSLKNNYESVYDTAEVEIADWKYEGGAFLYALEISSTLPEECLFTMSYDADYEEWIVSSKPHQDKQLYFNKDGKFGFYTKGSSYTPLMVFRDNDLPLQSEPTSVSVSFTPIEGTDPQEYMNTVNVGEQFPWTSALVVTAKYSGGASKVIPVGGYTMKQMPDTSVIGPAKGIISYGQNGHQIDKEFTIIVKGNTQAFDVVCKDPILVGETYQAHLEDGYEPPEGEPITWSVSNEALASIDQDGNVTGIAPGYVDVIATSYDGTYSDYEHIQIYQQVTSVTLDKHEVTLDAGQTSQLTATVLPTNASNKTVTYSSDKPGIAFVDSKTGLITAVSEGTATITCAAQNHPEENYDTCVVTVKAAQITHVESVSLNYETKDLEVGKTFTLSATIEPENASVKGVTWSSNHENIATVDQTGKVKGISKGQCIITATTADGGKTASCTVNVKNSVEPVPVTSVSLDITSKKIDVNGTFTLTATILPDNADTKTINWSSSDTSVATVTKTDATHAVVSGISNGTATITASCGGRSANCTVTVGSEPSPVAVESVSLDKTSLVLGVNEASKLIATINPSDATNKNVTWSSSDTSVATVDANGNVKGIAAGTATITVTTADGEKIATCAVTVTSAPSPVHVESVSLDSSQLTLDIGDEHTLVATVTPSNATIQAVTWKSSNTNIVTVDSNGKVTAVAEGEAVIFVTTVDGSLTATCHVIVNQASEEKKSDNSAAIVAGVGGTVAVAGVGCGVGIPLGLKAKKRKLHK